nr:UDP-glucose--hexose-1-phosphate uridylyltransferase [Propionispora sp. 2/2-37]
MGVYEVVQQLINEALAVKLLTAEDEIYVRNQILTLLGINDFVPAAGSSGKSEIPLLLEQLTAYACEQGIIEDAFDEKEKLSSRIMNCFIPLPSVVNACFYEKYTRNPREATDYFYALSRNSNYIQTQRIAKNISYKAATGYGELDITINLSKPEKNPRDIAREKLIKSTHYPPCLLCVENEGYAGRPGHPARSNHRLIRLNLLGEPWYLQYSPYVYYNEHCIILSGEHREMKIDRKTLERLLAFVECMPHYFVGSNADLPIVGGSILSHDHYQGGRYEFAMARAKDEYSFVMGEYPEVLGTMLKWPMAVIRLRSSDTAKLVAAGDYLVSKWRKYSDPAAGILAYTGAVPHNTVTPIARQYQGLKELDLVLRNNRTSDEHPLGIFHPHADVQHIKKENIGLIEVMGLAVLPERLKTELQEVEAFLLNNTVSVADYHLEWARALQEKYKSEITAQNVRDIVRKETAAKFLRVLEDAGVFKRDEAGVQAFHRFIEYAGGIVRAL